MRGFSGLVPVLLIGVAFVGCSSTDKMSASWKRAGSVTTIELTGTKGALYSGYYVTNGEKVEVSGTLPETISAKDVSAFEFRKADRQATLTLAARDDTSYMNPTSVPGSVGLSGDLAAGWSVRTIKN